MFRLNPSHKAASGTGRALLVCVLAIPLLVPPEVHAASEEAIARSQRVAEILKDNCFRCHGEEGLAEGGLDNVLNIRKLVARQLIIPGNPDDSIFLQRVASGDMPADSDPLSTEDQNLLRLWIEEGALDFNAEADSGDQPFVSPRDVYLLIEQDLKTLNGSAPQFARYFSLVHLANAGASNDALQTYREGLSKLVNSLSWGEKIVVPQPIDDAQTLFRIDLRNYRWKADIWDKVAAKNPYHVNYQFETAQFVRQITGTKQPLLRADWFVAVSSVPPLYHDILELPDTDTELEELLDVDVERNIEKGLALRSGFNNSGVSQNNRMIERHDSAFGAYWKSYDFSGNSGNKNLFAHPLGPAGENAFEHDGGEIIFNLPNGLQAYLLVDAAGKRIDKGPVDIVSDTNRPDRSVINGLSCMSCHTAGMIPKTDQIRASVEKNPGAFSPEERKTILSLYPRSESLGRLMDQDKQRFLRALTQAGVTSTKTDPILQLARQFEQELDLSTAAAESGLSLATFTKLLSRFPQLARIFAPLSVPGGTVQREVFVENFAEIAREFALRQDRTVNSIGMQMVKIPQGLFQMGAAPDDDDAQEDEKPRHAVTISNAFMIGANEVTVGQYRQFVEETGRRTSGGYRFDADRRRFILSAENGWDSTGLNETDEHPVVNVSWDDALAFCRWLSRKEGKTYRLPTEAEWEYACRAETATRFASGDSEDNMFIVGNFAHDAVETLLQEEDEDNWEDGYPLTAPAGLFQPNRFGLFDMHGNVWEWCLDRYNAKAYERSKNKAAPRPSSASQLRIVRGGSWAHAPKHARSSDRMAFPETERNLLVGFRVVQELQ